MDRGENQQADEIEDQIAASMFAVLLNLDRQVRDIMAEAGISDEEDEWIEDNSGV